MRPMRASGLLLGLLLLGGCGDAEPPAEPPAADEPAGRAEAQVLAALHGHLADGSAMDAEQFAEDARRVAEALWPMDAGRASPDAQVHLELSMVAAEVVRWLDAGIRTRDDLAGTHAADLAIHDAYRDAVVTGPTRYRDWVAHEGTTLLEELRAARRAAFFGR
mgnify:CR=1 FL=1